MRFDRLLAILFIAASLLAAASAWWTGDRRGGVKADLATASDASIAMIDVYGTISDSKPGEDLFGSSGAGAIRLIKAIRRAEKDGVKAILLRINSPGGTAAASQAIYSELMRVRRAGRITIVTTMGDMAASGGYYIAAASDHIVANPATTTGSIGVILHVQNVQQLFDKLGVGTTTIKSGPRKDILSPFRPMAPEERALLQGLVDDTYRQFLEAIVAGRKMPMERLRPLADGRVFTGEQAHRVGLVDSLGNYEDAILKTASLAGLKGTPKVRNYTSESLWEGLVPKLETKLSSLLSVGAGAAWNKLPMTLLE